MLATAFMLSPAAGWLMSPVTSVDHRSSAAARVAKTALNGISLRVADAVSGIVMPVQTRAGAGS